jgi:putative copper resistance protein D
MEQSGLIAARALVYLALLPATGLPIYYLTAATGAPMPRTAKIAAVLLSLLAALATLWWLAASVAAMAATPLAEIDRETIVSVAQATPLGLVVELRLMTLFALIAALLLPLPRWVAALMALVAVGSAALAGHAGATEGALGTVHRVADGAHLAAAACWIAALAVFLGGALRHGSAGLGQRLERFAATGTGVVLVLAITGIVNALLIAGWPLPLTSTWGLLLIAKLALFAGMLGFAAINRWKLTPAFAQRGDPRELRASLALESVMGIAVLLIVAVLGTLDPAGG